MSETQYVFIVIVYRITATLSTKSVTIQMTLYTEFIRIEIVNIC